MENVRVGVGVCIINNGKFLIGERLSKLGENTYAFPGGHLEFGETWEETAIREVKEETGLDVKEIKYLGITNDIHIDTNKHYITIFVTAKYEGGEPINLEPHKCVGWEWIKLEELENKQIFLALKNLLKSEFKEILEKELNK